MRSSRKGWRFGLVSVGVVLMLAGGVTAFVPSWIMPRMRRDNPMARVETVAVRRSDLNVRLTASGRVDSSRSTIIECDLENLGVSVRGVGMVAGGASTILSVIPDGSRVKKDDVLCVLDSSDYVELERQQAMNVDRARADYRQSVLTLDVAKTGVREYREGIMLQEIKGLEGQIALTKADIERAQDRLQWTRRMCAKGYVPQAQLSTDELTLDQLAFSLTQGKTRLKLFQEFSAPKYLRILESEVLSAAAIENYQSRRFQRYTDRLDNIRRQIARCTITAPHDGLVIYANEQMRQTQIEPGMAVRQRQRLFYLPDLEQMEVVTMVHESVVKEVKPGQLARVKIEALNGRTVEGRVTSIMQVPTQDWFSEVKYFTAKVKLAEIPRGLLPNMSAEVEIFTVRRPDVLTVPPESIVYEDGQDYCVIAHEDSLERRAITLGQTTEDLLEVTDGLDEGDEIVLDPTLVDVPAAAALDVPVIDSAG